MTIKPQVPTATDTTGSTCQATVAITGIVALLARSQARRLAEQATPANADTAPGTRRIQP